MPAPYSVFHRLVVSVSCSHVGLASCLLGQLTHSPGVLEVGSTEVLIHLLPGGSYGGEFKRSVSQTFEAINQRQLAHPKLPGRRLRFRLAHRSELDLKVRIGT